MDTIYWHMNATTGANCAHERGLDHSEYLYEMTKKWVRNDQTGTK